MGAEVFEIRDRDRGSDRGRSRDRDRGRDRGSFSGDTLPIWHVGKGCLLPLILSAIPHLPFSVIHQLSPPPSLPLSLAAYLCTVSLVN